MRYFIAKRASEEKKIIFFSSEASAGPPRLACSSGEAGKTGFNTPQLTYVPSVHEANGLASLKLWRSGSRACPLGLMPFIYRLLAEFFVAGSFTLLILLILEDFAPGVVTLWLNLRLLALIVGLTGILSLLFSKDYDKVK